MHFVKLLLHIRLYYNIILTYKYKHNDSKHKYYVCVCVCNILRIYFFCIETNYIFLEVYSRSVNGNQPRGKLRLKSIYTPRDREQYSGHNFNICIIRHGTLVCNFHFIFIFFLSYPSNTPFASLYIVRTDAILYYESCGKRNTKNNIVFKTPSTICFRPFSDNTTDGYK